MTRKLSSAEPPIARHKPPIARYKPPIEEDYLRKRGRRIEISSEPSISSPGRTTRSLFLASIEKEKRLIILDEHDKGVDNVLNLIRITSGDIGLEFTDYGLKLYVRENEGITKLDVLMHPSYFLEIKSEKARYIFPKLCNEPKSPLHFYKIYAVLMDTTTLHVQDISVTLLRSILIGERKARLFFGRGDSFISDSIDRVKILEK